MNDKIVSSLTDDELKKLVDEEDYYNYPYEFARTLANIAAQRASEDLKRRQIMINGSLWQQYVDQHLEAVEANKLALAPWLSAALEDPYCCEEYKEVIREWMELNR